VKVGADTSPAPGLLLEARGLLVDFDGFRALDGVDVSVGVGELVGIAGTNGAGKSTLFGALAGQVGLAGGSVRFAGHVISREPPHRRARAGLARTFQVPREFGRLSVLENLLVAAPNPRHETLFAAWLGRSAATRHDSLLAAHADELLELTRLAHVRNEPAASLSGGQKKLLELARALMGAPRCILLDEPFAGVNPVLINQLIEVLRAIQKRGVALVVIEHHLQALRALVERLIVMDQGRVIAEGEPGSVLEDPLVAEAYMGGVL
jgi:branched-chain amino acid transport system ATP-binding protein